MRIESTPSDGLSRSSGLFGFGPFDGWNVEVSRVGLVVEHLTGGLIDTEPGLGVRCEIPRTCDVSPHREVRDADDRCDRASAHVLRRQVPDQLATQVLTSGIGRKPRSPSLVRAGATVRFQIRPSHRGGCESHPHCRPVGWCSAAPSVGSRFATSQSRRGAAIRYPIGRLVRGVAICHPLHSSAPSSQAGATTAERFPHDAEVRVGAEVRAGVERFGRRTPIATGRGVHGHPAVRLHEVPFSAAGTGFLFEGHGARLSGVGSSALADHTGVSCPHFAHTLPTFGVVVVIGIRTRPAS